MRFLASILTLLLLTGFSHAQQLGDSKLEVTYILEGIEGHKPLGKYISLPEKSKPKVRPVGLLTIDSKGKSLGLKAETKDRDRVPIDLIESKGTNRTYIIVASGKVYIDLITYDPKSKLIEFDSKIITIGEEKPDDEDPDPTPDDEDPSVPDDDFDNIGQRVAKWAKGLKKVQVAATVYKNAAMSLRIDPSKTINDVSEKLISDLKVGVDFESYSKLRANINADLQERWSVSPLSRGVLADYFDAIAAGLEKANVTN